MKKISGIVGGLLMAASLATAQEARPLSKGQSLYLPIYSHMLYGNISSKGHASRVLLSAMVSIRNTDGKRPIRVLSARYYDTGGRFLRDYVPTAHTIPPLGTLELFVELNDETGGSGANFVINWDAVQPSSPPLVEALHANMDSGKAVIVTTQGVPVVAE